MKKNILLTVLLSCALQATATIYVYKDAKGNMVYSDLPLYHLQEVKKEEPSLVTTPAQQTTTDKAAQPKKPLTPEEYNKQIAEQNKAISEKNKQINEQNKKQEEEHKKRLAEDQKYADKVRTDNCNSARKNLESARAGRQANKEEAIKSAQEQVNNYCN